MKYLIFLLGILMGCFLYWQADILMDHWTKARVYRLEFSGCGDNTKQTISLTPSPRRTAAD